MRYFISLLLANLLFFQPAFATLNDVDKSQIYSKTYLLNGGFENGKALWTPNDTADFTVTASTPLIGLQHGVWDADASTDTLVSPALTIKPGDYGRNGVVSCLFVTASGTSTHEIQAYDGSNILSEATITSSTSPTRASANFTFPSSGTVQLRVYANADEPSLKIDDCYLGPAEGYNVGSVSQASFIGSAYFALTASCVFTRTNTVLGAMADTDCPGPTVESNPGPGTIQTTDANAPIVTVNNLPPGVYRVLVSGQSGISSSSTWSSLTISDGTTQSGQKGVNTNTSVISPFSVEGVFTYTTAGNRSFELYAASSTAALNIDLTGGNQGLRFYIYRSPLTSEMSYTPDKVANSWSGYHDGTCSWARTNVAYGDPTADASCALVETTNTNFGTVSTSGSVLPAITFTPSRAGKYWVCALFGIASTATNPTLNARLTDGTTTIAETTRRYIGATGVTDFENTPLCGQYVATSTTAKTLSIQTAASTGAASLQMVGSVSRSSIEWSIFQIDQSLPAPLLVNSVVTPYSGVMRIVSAQISSTGVVSNETGDWINGSASISGTSIFTLVWNSGIFSGTPNCQATPAQKSAVNATIGERTAATSSGGAWVTSNISGNALTVYDWVLFCMGPS
jgi:hypothetical protein